MRVGRSAALAMGVVVAAALTVVPDVYRHVRHALTGSVEAAVAPALPRPPDWPPAGVGASDRRLRPPVAAPPGKGGFTFENVQADRRTPVGWDPCRPVRYVVRGTAPAGAERIVAEAVAQIGEAAGLRFDFVGRTDEEPVARRAPYQPERYGKRWAPVLVAWSTPTQTPALAGDTMGLGGAWRFPEPTERGWGRQAYVTGSVVLDRPQFVEMLSASRPEAAAVARAVVVHELGHVLGLAHVTERRELMYPETQPEVTSLRAGDRRGLAALGRVPCTPAL